MVKSFKSRNNINLRWLTTVPLGIVPLRYDCLADVRGFKPNKFIAANHSKVCLWALDTMILMFGKHLILYCLSEANLVHRAHVSFGQHEDTEL